MGEKNYAKWFFGEPFKDLKDKQKLIVRIKARPPRKCHREANQ